MEITAVKVEKPENINIILGQAHFIKTVEDIHETLVTSIPNVKFGLAFCESSGPCLVRWSGTEENLIKMARDTAMELGAGHSFIIFLADAFPINVLNGIKKVPEVCRIFCATANDVEVIVGETDLGRGILGVVDGKRSKGIESEKDIEDRKLFLRKIGYKF